MATQLNEPFLMEKEETSLVKPSQPTPSHLLSLSIIDNSRDLEFHAYTIHVYCSNDDVNRIRNDQNFNNLIESHDFFSQFDPSSAIQEALSEALVYYYPLAGRLKRHEDGKLRVHCTSEGVPFLAANANCTLASLRYFNGVDIEFANQFVFDVEVDSACPLAIQVTKFTCGGFTVGMALTHSVCDGFGSAQFIQAVAEIASGKSEPSVKPLWERYRLELEGNGDPMLYPRDPLLLATSPYYPTLDIVHEIFNVDSESIRKLKMGLMQEVDNSGCKESFTTLEILGAYVWRSKFRSMEMNLDGGSNFSLTIGIRDLLDPPLPKGYYGNAFVPSSLLTLAGKDLCEGPLSRVVKLIKESKKNGAKAEHMRFWLGLLDKFNKENAQMEGIGSNLIITDWRHLGLFEIGIGRHHLVDLIPLPGQSFGNIDVCIFLPPFSMDPSMKGGVRVLVTLPRAAMAKFKNEMDSLKVLEEIKV